MKESALNVEAYLRTHAENIQREQDKLRQLIEMSVTIRRRQRNLTISDAYGRFGTRPETRGRWLDYDPDLDGEVHPISIVQPAFRANTNACLQSNPVPQIKATNTSAKKKQIAEKWQRVANYLDRTEWDENARTFLFDAVQADGTTLVEVYDECEELQEVEELRERNSYLAKISCKTCGFAGRAEMPDSMHERAEQAMNEDLSEISCPKCQAPASAMISKLTDYETDETEVERITPKSRLIPFYNFTIDSYNAKTGGIKTAKWLQIQELVDRADLEHAFRQFEFKNSDRWCYALRADYALANGDFNYLNYMPSFAGRATEFEKFEQRKIYLHEEAYRNYVAPEAFKFVNADGEVTFKIEKGQTFKQALEKLYGYNPQGFCFVWQDERIIDIVSPEKEQTNFRKRFSEVHFNKDSTSFHSSPNYAIVAIQDDITLLNTMNHNIIARNAVNPVYFDSLVFEESDFSKEFVGSKNAALIEDRDINKSITQLPVPTPSPHLLGQLTFLFEIKDSVTMVQPALRGDQQKGETYAAQRQQLEQSYGLLTAVLKSYANAKVNVLKQKLERCKERWTLQQFQEAASAFGEIWSDDDVQEMCEADFEKDLIFSYKDGSEMPQSNYGKEMKFMNGLAQLMPLVQANPALLGSEKMTKILQKIDEFAEFDFDLSGLETVDAIAQKRWLEISLLAQGAGNISADQIEAMRQQVVSADPTTGESITALDVLVEQMFWSSNIRFTEYEDLPMQRAFFIEQLNTEIGKDKPNELLIELAQVLISMLEQAQDQKQAEEIMSSPEMQMQMAQMQGGQQLQTKQLAEQNQREDEKSARQRQNQAVDSQLAHVRQMQLKEQGANTQI